MITIDTDTTWSEDKDYSGEDILITNGATLTIDSHAAGDRRLYIICDNLTIDAGAKISGDGKGYRGGKGASRTINGEDGEGPGGGGRAPKDTSYGRGGGGGGYGGNGGNGGAGGGGGTAYGNENEAIFPGSGGGGGSSTVMYYDHAYGGNGGAGFGIWVKNKLVLNGAITSKGSKGTDESSKKAGGGGGGSGGGIQILCRILEGSGEINVDGGKGGSSTYDGCYGGGGGAGGRIALFGITSNSQITLSASGGQYGTGTRGNGTSGQSGTIVDGIRPSSAIVDEDIKFYKCQNWEEGDSHGGDISEEEITSDELENIFDNVTDEERVSGKTEYRKIFVKFSHPIFWPKLWIDQFTSNPDDEIFICASGTNEDTQAEAKNYSYSSPDSFENGIELGLVIASGYKPIWIKRVVQPNSRPYHFNTFRLGVGF